MSLMKGFTKFNVGDLVCLSAYGKARDYNDEFVGHWGMVVEIKNKVHFPYKIKWLSKPDNWEESFHPREIKHFKLKKIKNFNFLLDNSVLIGYNTITTTNNNTFGGHYG